jgi:hypothetical protein
MRRSDVANGSLRELLVDAEKAKEVRAVKRPGQSKFARLLDADVGTLR